MKDLALKDFLMVIGMLIPFLSSIIALFFSYKINKTNNKLSIEIEKTKGQIQTEIEKTKGQFQTILKEQEARINKTSMFDQKEIELYFEQVKVNLDALDQAITTTQIIKDEINLLIQSNPQSCIYSDSLLNFKQHTEKIRHDFQSYRSEFFRPGDSKFFHEAKRITESVYREIDFLKDFPQTDKLPENVLDNLKNKHSELTSIQNKLEVSKLETLIKPFSGIKL